MLLVQSMTSSAPIFVVLVFSRDPQTKESSRPEHEGAHAAGVGLGGLRILSEICIQTSDGRVWEFAGNSLS